MLHKARELPQEARGVVENLIGRPLAEDETFSIRPVRIRKEGATEAAAGEIAKELEEYFAEVDLQRARTAVIAESCASANQRSFGGGDDGGVDVWRRDADELAAVREDAGDKTGGGKTGSVVVPSTPAATP